MGIHASLYHPDFKKKLVVFLFLLTRYRWVTSRHRNSAGNTFCVVSRMSCQSNQSLDNFMTRAVERSTPISLLLTAVDVRVLFSCVLILYSISSGRICASLLQWYSILIFLSPFFWQHLNQLLEIFWDTNREEHPEWNIPSEGEIYYHR